MWVHHNNYQLLITVIQYTYSSSLVHILQYGWVCQHAVLGWSMCRQRIQYIVQVCLRSVLRYVVDRWPSDRTLAQSPSSSSYQGRPWRRCQDCGPWSECRAPGQPGPCADAPALLPLRVVSLPVYELTHADHRFPFVVCNTVNTSTRHISAISHPGNHTLLL